MISCCALKKMNNVNTKDEYTLAAKCQGIFMCEIRTADAGGVFTQTHHQNDKIMACDFT